MMFANIVNLSFCLNHSIGICGSSGRNSVEPAGRAKMQKALLSVVALVTAVAATPGNVYAKPKIIAKTKYYSISGTTSRELKNQMKRKGPRGYWAYAGWHVRWSGDCRITVEISYEYPKWKNRNEAPAALRTSWDRMMTALMKHEQQHGQHGINAAREIDKSKCAGDPRKITSKWARQDKTFDRQTNHGRNQGVVLP